MSLEIKLQAKFKIYHYGLFNGLAKALQKIFQIAKIFIIQKKFILTEAIQHLTKSLMRRLINENEIKLKLEEAGFKSVRLGEISLEKQIQTFRHAETIVELSWWRFFKLNFL